MLSVVLVDENSLVIYARKHIGDRSLLFHPESGLVADVAIVNKNNRERKVWIKTATQQGGDDGNAAHRSLAQYMLMSPAVRSTNEELGLVFLTPKQDFEGGFNHHRTQVFLNQAGMTQPINFYSGNTTESMDAYCREIAKFLRVRTKKRLY